MVNNDRNVYGRARVMERDGEGERETERERVGRVGTSVRGVGVQRKCACK